MLVFYVKTLCFLTDTNAIITFFSNDFSQPLDLGFKLVGLSLNSSQFGLASRHRLVGDVQRDHAVAHQKGTLEVGSPSAEGLGKPPPAGSVCGTMALNL